MTAPALAEISDELYRAPAEDFVRLRTERVADARAAGDRELAKAVGALRRPTRSAWVVNLLAREAGEELQQLLDLGEALREAQQALSGPDLRRLSTQRHRAVEALAGRAGTLAAEHDVVVSEAVRREVVQSLQAALADPDVAAEVRAGRLAQVPSYGGFGPFSAGPADPRAATEDAPPTSASGSTTATKKTAGSKTSTRATAEQEQAEQEQAEREQAEQEQAERERLREEAAEALEQAGQAVSAAETALNDAETERDRLGEAEHELREALVRAEAATAEAQETFERAQQELDGAQVTERQAQARLDALGR